LAGVAILALVLALTHSLWLRVLAWPLVADETPPARYTAVVLYADPSLDAAVAAHATGAARRVLVVGWAPGRLEKLGVVPPGPAAVRAELLRRGVPATDLELLAGEPHDLWEVADKLAMWLAEHPDDEVAVYVSRLRSRRVGRILSKVLGDRRDRAHVIALADPEYDENNWWRSKPGALDFCEAWTRLAYGTLHGRPPPPTPDFDPDAFERGLR
jgi:hypothetical protein